MAETIVPRSPRSFQVSFCYRLLNFSSWLCSVIKTRQSTITYAFVSDMIFVNKYVYFVSKCIYVASQITSRLTQYTCSPDDFKNFTGLLFRKCARRE